MTHRGIVLAAAVSLLLLLSHCRAGDLSSSPAGAAIAIGGTLSRGVGPRAIHTGGETVTWHLSGLASFRADVPKTELYGSITDALVGETGGTWNQHRGDLLGVGSTVEVSANRKTIRVTLAPVPQYRASRPERVRLDIPLRLIEGSVFGEPLSFLVLTHNRLAVRQPNPGTAGDDFSLTLDGMDANALLAGDARAKLVEGTDCAKAPAGRVHASSAATLVAWVPFGAERFTLCYIPDDEPASVASSPLFVAADGQVSVAGPRSFELPGESTVGRTGTPLTVAVAGYSLTEEDTLAVLLQESATTTCADLPVDTIDQVDVALGYSSNRGSAVVEPHTPGYYLVCYLRSGSRAFVEIPGRIQVLGTTMAHTQLLVEDFVGLHHDVKVGSVHVREGGILRLDTHHVNTSIFEWSGGSIVGQGKLFIKDRGVVTGDSKFLSVELINFGHLTLYVNQLNFTGAARITNYGRLSIVVNATAAFIGADHHSRDEWHRIFNARGGHVDVTSTDPTQQLHLHVPLEGDGDLTVSGAQLWAKHLSSGYESTTLVEKGQLVVTHYTETAARLVATNEGLFAFTGEVRLTRTRFIGNSSSSNVIITVDDRNRVFLDSVSVIGTCKVFIQGLRTTGTATLQGFNVFGSNTTLSLHDVHIGASAIASIIAHGHVLCNVTSVTFGDQVMLSAYLRAVFFGSAESTKAQLIPQVAPANATLTIPRNATLILLDTSAKPASPSGPHLCAQYVVIPVHIVSHGEVALWGCATMPFGGRHTGIATDASADVVASLSQYAMCQLSVNGGDASGLPEATAPAEGLCVPIFPQDTRPVSGLLLSGSHVMSPATSHATPTPSISLDSLRISRGRVRSTSPLLVELAQELLIDTTGSLSLVAGADMTVPTVDIRGLLEVDSEFPVRVEGHVALRGQLDVSLALDSCSPPISSRAMTVHQGATIVPSMPESTTASYGQMGVILKADSVIVDDSLKVTVELEVPSEVEWRHNELFVHFIGEAPPARRALAASLAAASIPVACLVLFVGLVGPSSFLREMVRAESLALHLAWPEFAAFTSNHFVAFAFLVEALLLCLVAFHPLLTAPHSFESVNSVARFFFGLSGRGAGATAGIALECFLIAVWAILWTPFLGARLSDRVRRVLVQDAAHTQYAVLLLHQFHTAAAWIALLGFFPIVSSLLDAPLCATLFSQTSMCSEVRVLAPVSAVCLLIFLLLAPHAGSGQFAYCHPPFTREVDLRMKRTSVYLHCFTLAMIAALWKINGHHLPSVVGITTVGVLVLLGIHGFTHPCAFSNVNQVRQGIFGFPLVACIAAATQVLRSATHHVCADPDHVFVLMLVGGWLMMTVVLFIALRRAGRRARAYTQLLEPTSHRALLSLRDMWSQIEAEKLAMYNAASRRTRDNIAQRIQSYRRLFLDRLDEYRHAKEPEFAEYYLGDTSHREFVSPSTSLREMAPLADKVRKNVTDEDIERITPSQMANFAEGPVLGRGTYGVVYMGMLPGGKLLAVKVIPVSKKHKTESISAVRREVDVLRNLRHRHVIQFYGCHTNRRDIYIFMELATNGSLTQLARKFGRIPEPNLKMYTRQMLSGLAYLHAQGIVHRDVKGENILIDGNGAAKLGDFGCSKALAEATNRSREGCESLVGSPYWMAPEVIRSETYGTKADVWSLGCTVVEMINGGQPPWIETFDNVYSAMFFIGNSTELPTNIPEDITTECRSFLEACFTRDVASRASVAELLAHEWLESVEETPETSPTGVPGASSSEETMNRGWSELFESDSEVATSRGATLSRASRRASGQLDISESIPLQAGDTAARP